MAYDYQNPIELNRYVYTANNPINYDDPTGLGMFEYLTSFVRNQAWRPAGGAYGALVGYAGGSLMGGFTWRMVNGGLCGDRHIDMSITQYMQLSGAIGAAIGGMVGFMPLEFASYAGAMSNAFGLLFSVADMSQNGPNLCNIIGAFSSHIGGTMSMSNLQIPIPLPNGFSIQFGDVAGRAMVIVNGSEMSSGFSLGSLFMMSNKSSNGGGNNKTTLQKPSGASQADNGGTENTYRDNLNKDWPLDNLSDDFNWQAHHLVPKGHRLAERARAILTDKGININSSANLTWLPAYRNDATTAANYYDPAPLAHRGSGLGNDDTVRAINTRIVNLKNASQSRIIQELDTIANDLLRGILP